MDHQDENKNVAASCGLYCRSCSLYIASKEDQARLEMIAKRFNQSPEEIRCHGCHSGKVGNFCSECSIKSCAKSRGLLFCAQCDEFPCDKIKDFQSKAPHRAELWEALDLTNKLSLDYWVSHMDQLYSCEKCGTINSAYDLSCRGCGFSPSNSFVKTHFELIKNHLENTKKTGSD